MEINFRNLPGRPASLRIQAVLLFLSLVFQAGSQTLPDSVRRLKEVEVRASVAHGPVDRRDGSVTVDSESAARMPRLFGENDLMRVLTRMAGISSISDYSSGISADGMDYSQSSFLVNGIEVGIPYHFGGIFSTFNSGHYPSLTMRKDIRSAGSSDNLGAVVESTTSSSVPLRTRLSANVGMLASSFTLRQPVGARFTITASARTSYIDALYHKLLANDHTDVHYNFLDTDIDILCRYDKDNTFNLFGHYNGDFLKYDDDNYDMDTHLKWHNALAGVRWKGRNGSAILGYAESSNKLDFSMASLRLTAPSSFREWSGKGHFGFSRGIVGYTIGGSAQFYTFQPQWVDFTGSESFGKEFVHSSPHIKASLFKLWSSARINLNSRFRIELGADFNQYVGRNSYKLTDVDPRFTLFGDIGETHLIAHAGRYRQYIHLVGFSEIGMPSNFRIPAERKCPPQEALNFVVAASRALPWFGLDAKVDVFWKRILNQPEYDGGVLDLLDSRYEAYGCISNTSGNNSGFNIGISRNFKNFIFSAGYGFVRARRRLSGGKTYFTAASEIRNSLNLNASYDFPGGHWNVNLAFAYASGRPVTPITAIYFVGGSVMVEYGKRNSSHLPDYHRLDLGASYRFKFSGTTNRASFSLINAYGHKNVEISTYTFNTSAGNIRRRNIASLYRFLPSVSYSIEF